MRLFNRCLLMVSAWLMLALGFAGLLAKTATSSLEHTNPGAAVSRATSEFPPYETKHQDLSAFTVFSDDDLLSLAESLGYGFPAAQLRVQPVTGTVAEGPGRNWWGEETAVALLDQPMSETERRTFERTMGFAPKHIQIGFRPVVVIVHRDNPIARRGMTLAELDAAYSVDRHRGHEDVRLWGDLNTEAPWKARAIAPYGYDVDVPWDAYFQERVLQGGDYKPELVRTRRPNVVAQTVQRNSNAIGFVPLQEIPDNVAIVPLGKRLNGSLPDAEAIEAGRYPLANPLYLYFPQLDEGALEPAVQEFVRFVLSREGQKILVEHDRGFFPLTWSSAKQQAEPLGLSLPEGK